jgi:hypothetical protein
MDRIGRGAMRVMNRSLPFLAILVACACLPFTKSVGEADTEGASSDEGSSTGTLPSETCETSNDPPSSSESTTSTTGSESTGESTGGPPSFACPPAQGEEQCDPFAQDCPSGFHCLPWLDEYGADIGAFVCAPLAGDPAGRYEACTEDSATCSDDCEAGTYCYPETPMGSGALCLGMCGSDGDDEACLAGEKCVTCATCLVGSCLPSCDPLAPQCPDDASACLWYEDDGFICMIGEPVVGALGDECEYVNWCSEGLVCVDASMVGTCAGPGCCTETCDLVDGDPACSDPTHACHSPYPPGLAPAGYEHVGICGLPEAGPCAIPGNCPPPVIDDTYPWCSETNDAYCPDGVVFSYTGLTDLTGDLGCESFCQCQTPCMGDSDCPQPATGTATPECMEDPLGISSPTSCMLSCDAGQTCPDGMTCIDFITGEPTCMWISPVVPEECPKTNR